MLAAIVLSLIGLLLAGPAADAQTTPDPSVADVPCDGTAEAGSAGFVDVVEANGLIDQILINFLEERIAEGNAAGVRQIVLQMDSKGSAVDDDEIVQLARVLRDSEVPVAIWVGPSGSELKGASAQLAPVVDALGIANGSKIGDLGPPILPSDEFDGFGLATPTLTDGTINADDAALLDIIEQPTPILGEFLLTQDVFDFCLRTSDDGVESAVPLTTTRFFKLNLFDQQFHSVASAPVAYLLFLAGMSLLIFELFTAGVGVAGVVGAVCFLLGSFGFGVLPTRPAAIALLVASGIAFAIDVQVGVPRFWSAVGSVCLIVGSLFIYDDIFMGWIPLAAGLIGTLLAMLNGMPAMVRTRFSTPTIGREWMIGETAEAVTALDPDGTVRFSGAQWPAVINRSTPVKAGESVRVTSIDRTILEVEPLEGAAKDYREMRNRSEDSSDSTDPGATNAADESVAAADFGTGAGPLGEPNGHSGRADH